MILSFENEGAKLFDLNLRKLKTSFYIILIKIKQKLLNIFVYQITLEKANNKISL